MSRNKDQSEQMRTESRKKILATSQRLFAERGFEGCSVSDIALQAGMSQGNIYWYFSSKEEILKTILIEGFHVLGSAMAEAAANHGTGIEKLDAFLKSFNALMREEGGGEFVAIVMTLIGHGGAKRFAELGLSTHQIGAGYHQSLNAIIAQGQAEGTIMQGIDPYLLAAFFFSFINGLTLMYPGKWKNIPPDVIREAAFRLLGCEMR